MLRLIESVDLFNGLPKDSLHKLRDGSSTVIYERGSKLQVRRAERSGVFAQPCSAYTCYQV